MKRILKPKVHILTLGPEDEEKNKKGRGRKRGESTETIHRPKKPTGKKKACPHRKHARRQPGDKISFNDDSQFSIIEKLDEDLIIEKEWKPVTAETRWKCLRCGWCCQQNWRINLTWQEYDRIKDLLTITEVVVDEETGMSHPVYTIEGHCEKYDPETRKCKIYRNRLYTCAAFPFIIDDNGELLHSKHCRGFGVGSVVDKKKMIKYLIKWRKKAGLE